MIIWLVVSTNPLWPLWKMMEWKSVGMMTFPTEWENKSHVPNHQPGGASHGITTRKFIENGGVHHVHQENAWCSPGNVNNFSGKIGTERQLLGNDFHIWMVQPPETRFSLDPHNRFFLCKRHPRNPGWLGRICSFWFMLNNILALAMQHFGTFWHSQGHAATPCSTGPVQQFGKTVPSSRGTRLPWHRWDPDTL